MQTDKEKTINEELQDVLQAVLAENAMLRADVKELKKLLSKKNAIEKEPADAKLQLMDELAHGHNYISYGECEGFDPVEKGCPGHEEKK